MISNYTHLTLNGLVCTEINGISGWMRHAEFPWRRHHRGTCIAVKHTIYGITKGVACAIFNVYISFTFFKWNHIFLWISHNSVWTVLVSRDIRINYRHISSVWYRKIKALKRNEQLKYMNFVQWDTRRICIILVTRQTVWLNNSTQYDHLYCGRNSLQFSFLIILNMQMRFWCILRKFLSMVFFI